jgi:hypothetical protein
MGRLKNVIINILVKINKFNIKIKKHVKKLDLRSSVELITSVF